MWTPAASICSPLMSSLSPHPFDVSVKMFSNWLLMAASREERQGHRVFLRDNTKLFAHCRSPAPRARGSACRESGYPDANEATSVHGCANTVSLLLIRQP